MEVPFVNAPIDPLAALFEVTAQDYEKYLDKDKGEWGRNQNKYAAKWAEHYEWMDTTLACRILEVSKEQKIPLEEMNFGLIGPGFHPVGHDISSHTVKVILAQLHRIIVIDFSLNAVRSAVTNLMEGGVPPEKIFGMQFDVTRGLSTMFRNHIEGLLQGIETEEEFCDVAERDFPKVNVGELQFQLGAALRNCAENPHTMPGDVVGVRSAKDLQISVNDHEPVPLHLTAFEMVLTGTNAATEAHIWERLREVTSDASVALPRCAKTERRRRDVYRLIHRMIAEINSEIAARAVARVLQDNTTPDNPRPVVCALTDIATIFKRPGYGMMPRLLQDPFQWRVGEMRGDAIISNLSVFNETPDHNHLVADIQVTKPPEELPEDRDDDEDLHSIPAT